VGLLLSVGEAVRVEVKVGEGPGYWCPSREAQGHRHEGVRVRVSVGGQVRVPRKLTRRRR